MVRLAEACGTEGSILDSAGAKRLADAGRMLPQDAASRIETRGGEAVVARWTCFQMFCRFPVVLF